MSKEYLKPTIPFTSHDVAWAAGIFEGEGCASPSSKGSNSGYIIIGQKNPWILRRLRARFGGSVSPLLQNGVHHWNLSGDTARHFAQLVYQYLSPRRRKQMRRSHLMGV
jgi:hypothetical protein